MLDNKSKIALIENELKRRLRENKIDYYNADEPIHKKQILFHQSHKRNRWVFGGNRSGKTECGAVESVYFARGNHPYRQINGATSGWVVSLSTQVQRDVAQEKILSYLKKEWIAGITMLKGKSDSPKSGVIDFIDVYNVFGTISRIGFKSCDQGREKFQGTSLDYVWFDEEPPKDIYEECRMRIIDKKGNIFSTMTPLKGLSWVYYDIYLNEGCDSNIATFLMEWKDNPHLDLQEIEDMSKVISKESLDSRRFGKFSTSLGIVYNEFDENVNVIEPFDVPREWQDTISIDPGLNNPLSCHFYACDYDGNVYVIYEHYEAGRDVVYHANVIKEICKKLDWHNGFNGKIDALIDSAASQRTLASSKSVAELFYENGINANTKVNKDLFTGINRVKNYLSGKPKLYIFKNCVHMIKEFKGYFWGNGDIPTKKDDHALDELRYYIMSKPQHADMIAPAVTHIKKEKEKLIRKVMKQNRRQ